MNGIGYRTSTFTFNGSVAITSPWGLVSQLPSGLLLMLCLVLPFVNADGVSRDLSRRTHELLMTTPLPNWSLCLGTLPGRFADEPGAGAPAAGCDSGTRSAVSSHRPDVSLARAWSGAAAVGRHGGDGNRRVSSLSFALGTVFMRQSTLVKIVIMLAWFVGAFVLPNAAFRPGNTTAPAWYVNWDPTSGATKFGLLPQYQSAWQSQFATATSLAQAQRIFIAVENMVPGNLAWLAPHLILAAGSLLLVLLAALTFQRFRNALAG